MAQFSRRDALIVVKILASMFRALGFALILPFCVSLWYGETAFALLFAAIAIALVAACSALRFFIKTPDPKLRHAVVSIALAWVLVGLVSSVPFVFYGMGFVDGFFESVSGWSGTGLTMVERPEVLPFSLNFWRAFTQWVGGFGIVILAMLILEKPKIARSLFVADGRTENFYLNVVKIARVLAVIYLFYTAIGIAGFLLAGLSPFDAVVHTFTTLATGGFSSNSVGVGAYGTWAIVVSIFLMVIGGISFMSHRELLRMRLREFWANPEVRLFFGIISAAMLLVSANMLFAGDFKPLEQLFYIISAITGTGATTFFQASQFPIASVFILILLMVSGACFGSTTGALKLWRILVVFKVLAREIRKVFLPAGAVTPIRIHDSCMESERALAVVAFVCLYLLLLSW
ncbi:MAG: hypothetical protein NTW59_04555 [Candidatus Diapherotrites archaeon]|nr:hypothetical protein [Candidatus Diapherotrites archaeon]